MRVRDAEVHQGSAFEQLDDVKKSAYEAGLASGREAAYQQGFQDGFLASLKRQDSSVTAKVPTESPSPEELTPNGRRLVGPPCSKCGHCYPGTNTHCPRCQTPAEFQTSEATAASQPS